jgi:predicted site-specific integrase-resolvase
MRLQGQNVKLLTIAEAAQRLGVSQDTVHRRLKKGQLTGRQQTTPQGFTWLIEMPVETCNVENGAPADTPADAPVSAGELQRLEQIIELLQAQVETKDQQIKELHVLLQQAQAALPAPREDRRSWWHFWQKS